jgi:hypothetical protein
MPPCLHHRSIGGGIVADTSCFDDVIIAVDTIVVSILGDIDAGTDFVCVSFSGGFVNHLFCDKRIDPRNHTNGREKVLQR